MIVVPPGTPAPNVVVDTESPLYLRVNDHWLHLNGVEADLQVDTSRGRDMFESLDGFLWWQQAPANKRTWKLDYRWATELAMRALRVAANYPGDVWLLHREHAVANMLAPLDCQGTGAPLLAGGMPLRRFVSATSVTSMVRGGVPTFLGVWTDAAAGTPVGTVTYPGGSAVLEAPAGTTAQRTQVAFTPDVDGLVTATVVAGTTGLQLTEDWMPAEWMPGLRAPCRVAVTDPQRRLNRMEDRSQGRGDYTVEIMEVGP
ncbi:hypothetical protein INN71_02775 [Nocardioides sp. ChNu-153]|uniref:hypothetical protein n=1 Tax=Nocardioides sp. ChNu-153 TaxID=2779364 RepID=UPI00264D014E|nr:hypothetical protein [Nocardioides sp. ChNu-153]MDN7120310.1 hypothetical protein [Nocardioides sp. ChNu-153]